MKRTVKERIKDFIEYKKISARAFEVRCGFSNGYLRQLRISPTVDKMENILSAFPEINREWLMTGEGEMLRNDAQQVVGDYNTTVHGNSNNVNSEVARFLSLLEKKDEQIDRLLSIIENQTKNQ